MKYDYIDRFKLFSKTPEINKKVSSSTVRMKPEGCRVKKEEFDVIYVIRHDNLC
jgi:hypothetical protein